MSNRDCLPTVTIIVRPFATCTFITRGLICFSFGGWFETVLEVLVADRLNSSFHDLSQYHIGMPAFIRHFL